MIGVMFVGLYGTNATTVIAGSTAMQKGIIPVQYGITENSELFHQQFADIHEMIFSGWDYYDSNVYENALKYQIITKDIVNSIPELKTIHAYRGIHTSMDIPLESHFDYYDEPKTVKEAIEAVKNNILDFKTQNSLDTIIVFYMGSPGKVVNNVYIGMLYDDIVEQPVSQFPSSVMYAIAAIESGAHFVDFTPSETLEFGFINLLAKKYGVQVSGRDGSTGQTMLKLTIANMLKIRNLHLDAWYSTNIIGNHDGYVLSMPEHSVTKIQDKTNSIKELLGYNFEHKVTIDYFKYNGDRKESWDAVYFNGWMNEPMSLRLNWMGEDAILAAPIILDIIRFIELGSRYGCNGFQKQLGLFYKHPFQCEKKSLSQLYDQLVDFYKDLSWG